jgi:hypothetical protein
MRKIKELFKKDVGRHIDGVIKADDERQLQIEVEEFVFTKEINKALDTLLERYLDEPSSNGVWISGYYGCGKSHLLKILSLILGDKLLSSGSHPSEIILPKIEDEIRKGNLGKAARIPSQSILFNIDQKADHVGGGDSTSIILEVFIKVFNGLRGYYDKQGFIAKFEYDLDKDNKLSAFKKTYQDVNGRKWENDRDALTTVRKKSFGKAYAAHFSVSEDEAFNVLNHTRDDYKVDIETFAFQVKEYIGKQDQGFRLNFFVDEVGQFIGNDSHKMLNLQTIAETLATVCDGRAWVFVTSQSELAGIIGDMGTTAAQDFSKIQGRFKSRVTLSSTDVKEVIQKRLLLKKEDEPEALTDIYDKEKDNLSTLYRFGDDSVEYKSWRGSDEFCDFYPLHPYQFELFQRCIEQLSKHDAFPGSHTSVGERSMIEVFQSVVKEIQDEEIGRLAAFDYLFEGIAVTLRGDIQTSVQQASRQLDDPIAIRVLRALFLLKWVRAFKSTIRNVAILLIDRPDVDIAAHEETVKNALELLTKQSYLQRNGDVYEFLTDDEKDIEVEIKNTVIDESNITTLLADILFRDVLLDQKIRFEINNQDYFYARKLDDNLIGREHQVCLNIITQDHNNHGSPRILAAQNTGKHELLMLLPEDARLMDEVRNYIKTQKYIQQNTGGGNDAIKNSILLQRGKQNTDRRKKLKDLCEGLMSKANFYINGSLLENLREGDPRNRFNKAAQELISFSFPSLRMLKGVYGEESLKKALLDPDDLLTGGDQILTEAEQEVLTYVHRNQDNGERTSVEEMTRNFEKSPYGWYTLAVTTLIARLFRMGKIELRNPDLLDAQKSYDNLKNPRLHGALRVRLQDQFDPAKVSGLKRFHHDFFDLTNPGTDARTVGQNTINALAQEFTNLESLLNNYSRYPFIEGLRDLAERVEVLSQKDYSYLLNHLDDFNNELLDAKNDIMGPVKAFINGNQIKIYDEVIGFLQSDKVNFSELADKEIQPLLDLENSDSPFKGKVVPAAKSAMLKVRKLIESKLKEQRLIASQAFDEAEQKIKQAEDFGPLNEDEKQEVLGKIITARADVTAAKHLTAIRDRVSTYKNHDFPAQLSLAAQLANKPKDGDKKSKKASTAYVSANSLHAKCDLSYISSEAELDEWLKALRAAGVEELKKGNRISL